MSEAIKKDHDLRNILLSMRLLPMPPTSPNMPSTGDTYINSNEST
jgi:hypothetical protein